MANEEQLALIKQGVDAWNAWRQENESIEVDLSRADLSGADLSGADLYEADLSVATLTGANLFRATLTEANLFGANLIEANLIEANLIGATLTEAHLSEANLIGADLTGADLTGAHLSEANLIGADLTGADLTGADLTGADLTGAHLTKADLTKAHLSEANLRGADLTGARLTGALLTGTQLVESDLTNANLTGCLIYGVSAWNLTLKGAQQRDLIITRHGEPVITVDNLEVAQFIYLLLHNEKIRDVIDTITSKAVLILGRFTPERKAVLDAIRDALRHRDYLPIVFDFDKPTSKDLTGTVSTLANMARFIIADLTDSSSVPHELAMVVPGTVVPVQPVLLEGQREYAMFINLKRRHHWVLEPYQYSSPELLIAQLEERVIGPAEAKARELRGGASL